MRYGKIRIKSEIIIKKAKKIRTKLKNDKVLKNTFEYKQFSKKQKQVLSWWCDDSNKELKEGIILDGAIRSGKTLCMSLSFVIWSMFNFNEQNFLICGKTIGTIRRNVINTLKKILILEGYSIRDIKNENLIIISKNNILNRFYLFGGKDESSQDSVQGITAAGVLFDEVVIMPQSFVNQAIARCSIAGSKYWFNCNPGTPEHWFKKEWINKAELKGLIYLHFTMEDNKSLDENIKERYNKLYKGVFYERYVKGKWVQAEGLIYDMFNEEKHIYSDNNKKFVIKKYIAIDYGTINPMVFLEIHDTGQEIYIVKEYYYSSIKEGKQKTDKEYADDLDKFLNGEKLIKIIIDPSAASFKTELKSRGYRVKEADNRVMDGIRMVSTLLSVDMIKVNKSCENTIKEFLTYTWDEKMAQNGKEQPLKQNDHCQDAIRYFVLTTMKGRKFANRWIKK